MPQKIKILRASNAASVPPLLEQGELAVNGLAATPQLWTGVPTARDPSGRINLLAFAAGGGTSVTIAINPPSNPTEGDLWLSKTDGVLHVWFVDGTPGQWVSVAPGPRGLQGVQGVKGDAFTFADFTPPQIESLRGPQGLKGDTGDAGANATLTIGTVTTGAAGSQASVSEASGSTAQARIFDLTIPRGDTGATGPAALPLAQASAPIMLAAANGAAVLTGTGPQLLRIGETVFCNYQGANKTTATANTISFAEIPTGYRPTAAVTAAIQTPAINITVSQPTTGTSVFPDNPGTNVANVATGAPTRWVMRHGTQFGANAAVSLAMQWRTSDAMP